MSAALADDDASTTAPVLVMHEELLVLRDDLVDGGTKRRILQMLVPLIKEEEIVYPGHAYGYAGLALGLAALACNKRVRIFYPSPRAEGVPIFDRTISLPNVTYSIEKVAKQHELVEEAKAYASAAGAYYMPIGCATQEFRDALVTFIKSLSVTPTEVWCMCGSGLLCRSICEAWPEAKVNAVSLGMSHLDVDRERVTVYNAPESPEEAASVLPPFPSAKFYDAKVWRLTLRLVRCCGTSRRPRRARRNLLARKSCGYASSM